MSTVEARVMRRHPAPQNPPRKESLTCPHLDVGFGTCSVYADRPVVCRLWGVVPALACPHGCVVERMLTSDEVEEIMLEIIAIDQSVVGEHAIAGYDRKAVEKINARLGVRTR